MAWYKFQNIPISQFDNGTFESAQSVWGAYVSNVIMSRSNLQAYEGSYSAILEGPCFTSMTVPSWMTNKNYIRSLLSFDSAVLAPGRYRIKCRLYIEDLTSWPLGAGTELYIFTDSGTRVAHLSRIVDGGLGSFYSAYFDFEKTDSSSVRVYLAAAWQSGYTAGPGRTDSQETFIDAVEIEEWKDLPSLNLSAVVEQPTYYEADDGRISLEDLENGSGDYTISWSNGASNVTEISGLAPGTYSVDIHDNITGQDQTIGSLTVTEPPPPNIDVSGVKSDVTCPGTGDGVITLSVSGGDGGPYTFLWSDGSTNQNRAGLSGGTYTVVVSDGSGGSGNASFTINEADPIVISATVSGTNIFIEVTGGTTPYAYAWEDGPTSSDRENVDPGEYTLEVTDDAGCTAEVTVTVAEFRFKFSQDPVILALQADDPGTKENLSFKCEVYVERTYKSEAYDLIATLEQPADSDGATVFDVQSILDGVEELKTHIPTANQSAVSVADSIFKRYYLRYTERYGDPPSDAPFSQSDIQYVVLGGLSYEEYASDYFFTDYLLTYPFFTWQANGRHVFEDEPHFLYFLVPEFNLSQFHVNVRINYLDGTFTDMTPFVQAGIERYELYCIPTGFTQLGIAAQSSKEVFSYSVEVVDQAGKVLSEKRTFLMIREHFSHKKFFMYRNAIGGFDTLAATAVSTLNASASSNTIVKNLPFDYAIEDGEEQIIRKDLERELEAGSGYTRRKIDLQRMQDFISSEDVFLFENDRYIPVIITAKGTVEDDTGNPMGIKFKAQLPKSRNYTPALKRSENEMTYGGEYLAVNDGFLLVNNLLLNIIT